MGDHSSAHGAFTPDPFLPDGTVDPHLSDPARDGVGNASRDDPDSRTLSSTETTSRMAGMALHGVFQALRFGDPFSQRPVESQLEPFVPTLHGQVSVELAI